MPLLWALPAALEAYPGCISGLSCRFVVGVVSLLMRASCLHPGALIEGALTLRSCGLILLQVTRGGPSAGAYPVSFSLAVRAPPESRRKQG